VRGLIVPLVVLALLAPGPPSAPADSPPERPAPAAIRTLRGTVQDVNLPRNQFTLRATGEEHLFVMAPRCKVGGEPVSDLRGLKPGDEASVAYEMTGGVKVAHGVVVHNPATR